MSLVVTCISCRRSFDAVEHAGLVRCQPCADSHGYSIPAAGANVVVIDTPGEAWA